MGIFEEGRVCVKLVGRDSGEKVVVTRMINKNTVEVLGSRGKREVSLKHINPLEQTIDIKNEESALAQLGVKKTTPKPAKTQKAAESKPVGKAKKKITPTKVV